MSAHAATFYQTIGRIVVATAGPYARPISTADPSPASDPVSAPCVTCAQLAPIGSVTPKASLEAPLEVVVHGDAADAHDFHTGTPGSFEAMFSSVAAARREGRVVLATIPLTRSSYRALSVLPLLCRARGLSALRLHVPALAEDARAALAPRLALSIPFALHAIAVAKRLELPAFISGAPICLLGPYAISRIETKERTYGSACQACPARAACPGLDAPYLRAYGDGEVRATKAAAPAPATHPTAALFRR